MILPRQPDIAIKPATKQTRDFQVMAKPQRVDFRTRLDFVIQAKFIRQHFLCSIDRCTYNTRENYSVEITLFTRLV